MKGPPLYMQRKWKCLLVISIASILFFAMFGERENVKTEIVSPRAFKQIYGETYIRKKPKLLVWTTFFGADWSHSTANHVSKLCNASCTVTGNKRELKTSDAIIFHLADICWGDNLKHGFSFQFPRYRRPDQSWVLFNQEPLPMVFGNFRGWQGIFNLTMSYSTNSDIQTPYGAYRRLSKNEISKNLHEHLDLNKTRSKVSSHNIDYYREKSKSGAIAIISNCFDEARRYRLIETISKFINVEILGKCGKPCPKDSAWCENIKHSYQFYLAFENSDCRDYVSEKYWSTLGRNQIPIVAWKHSMVGQVIPNSYINIYDFPDIESSGAFIKRVGENRTLYNSYFDWKKVYTRKYESEMCKLCDILSDHTKPAQSYVDLYGWFANFSCKPTTISGYLKRVYDRFMFDGKLL